MNIRCDIMDTSDRSVAMDKKIIGVLVPFLDQYYQRNLWQSIQSESIRRGYETIFFCGSVLDGPSHSDKNRNAIYRLPNPHKITGLIVMSGTLTNYSGPKRLMSWLEPYAHLPIVHVSLDLEDQFSVVVDNYNSMYGLMNHIMDMHDFSKFAYISGPKTNTEAIARRKAFTDMMNQSVHKVEQYIIYEGDFSKESAIEAVKQMKADNFVPDIVICANDEMAIGVHDAIYEMHLHLNDNTAFTGFDDIDNATIFSPAFTTVRQPLDAMGIRVVETLDMIINGQIPKKRQALAGETVVRTSCGCMPFQKANHHQRNRPLLVPGKTHLSIYYAVRDYLIWLTKNEPRYMHELKPYIEVLAEELMDMLPAGSFNYKCFKALNSKALFDGQDIATHMHQLYQQIIHTELILPNELHEIFTDLRLMASHDDMRKERADNYSFMTMYYYSAELVERMMTVKHIPEMLEVLVPYLEAYQLNGLFICLYDKSIICEASETFVAPEHVGMVCGYLNHQLVAPYTFETAQMVPNEVIESADKEGCVIYPLLFREHHFGYIASNTKNASHAIMRTIIQQISTTLERISLYGKLEAYNEQLSRISESDPLTNTLNRRGISVYMNQCIKENPDGRYGIIYCDVDGLKGINDQYGHSVGDEAILAVSDILKHAVKEIGQVSRLGGDEFMLVVKDAHLDLLNHIVERIEVGVDYFNERRHAVFKLGITTGISVWHASSEASFEMMIEYADRAMYDNKKRKLGS